LQLTRADAAENLDYLGGSSRVHKKITSERRALHQARQACQGDHSAAGLPDQERLKGLVPRIRETPWFVRGICGPSPEIHSGTEGGGGWALPPSWLLHICNDESLTLSRSWNADRVGSPGVPCRHEHHSRFSWSSKLSRGIETGWRHSALQSTRKCTGCCWKIGVCRPKLY